MAARKNAKSKIKYKDIEVDSQEEYQFFCWLDEAKELGIVKEYEYQPTPFTLTEPEKYLPAFHTGKGKRVQKTLLQGHIYTCDFKVLFNSDYLEILCKAFKIQDNQLWEEYDNTAVVFMDIKGGFNRHGGDRLFSIHQKLVYQKYSIFVEKVVPKNLFKKLGVAKANLLTPTGRASQVFGGYNYIATQFGLSDNKHIAD